MLQVRCVPTCDVLSVCEFWVRKSECACARVVTFQYHTAFKRVLGSTGVINVISYTFIIFI